MSPEQFAAVRDRPSRAGKRVLDLLVAGTGVLVFLPLFAVVSLLIKLSDGGPVFYRQERVGYRGQPFRMWKFRTMIVNADKVGKRLTIGADPRVTRIGGLIRRTKIDELPQLLNVLAGEMSMVGPRPEVSEYVQRYTDEQLSVLELLPGITDVASVKYRHEAELLSQYEDPESAYIQHVMPDKIRLNLEYASRASVLTDIGVIMRTAMRIVKG